MEGDGTQRTTNGGGDNPQITQITGLVGQPAGREIDWGGITKTQRHDDTMTQLAMNNE